MYSTTYIAEIAKFIAIGLVILNINIDAHSLEIALAVSAQIIAGLYTLYNRHKVGDVTTLGFYRK